jgi:hypothetical protein
MLSCSEAKDILRRALSDILADDGLREEDRRLIRVINMCVEWCIVHTHMWKRMERDG